MAWKELLGALLLVLVASSPVDARQRAPAKVKVKPAPKDKRLSDNAVARILIQQSIDEYPGNCPCPYHADRAGRRCGGRSAWSREGGYAPLCYRSDVTREMIAAWRDGYVELE